MTEHFQLGRFGQVVLSSGGRLPQPTNVVAPGAAALALQAANNLEPDHPRRRVADARTPTRSSSAAAACRSQRRNTLRGGDTATGIVGVLTYTWAGNAASGNAYRVRPVERARRHAPNFAAGQPAPGRGPRTSAARCGSRA